MRFLVPVYKGSLAIRASFVTVQKDYLSKSLTRGLMPGKCPPVERTKPDILSSCPQTSSRPRRCPTKSRMPCDASLVEATRWTGSFSWLPVPTTSPSSRNFATTDSSGASGTPALEQGVCVNLLTCLSLWKQAWNSLWAFGGPLRWLQGVASIADLGFVLNPSYYYRKKKGVLSDSVY